MLTPDKMKEMDDGLEAMFIRMGFTTGQIEAILAASHAMQTMSEQSIGAIVLLAAVPGKIIPAYNVLRDLEGRPIGHQLHPDAKLIPLMNSLGIIDITRMGVEDIAGFAMDYANDLLTVMDANGKMIINPDKNTVDIESSGKMDA